MKTETSNVTFKLAMAGLFAALAFVAFQFFKIPLALPGGTKTYFHLGNTFVALAALFLGGIYGGVAGAIGLSLADIMSGDPVYAITTFILKIIIGVVTGAVAHRVGKINEITKTSGYIKWAALASAAGLGVNIITDPVLGYFRNRFFFGINEDFSYIVGKLTAGVTFVNAVLSCICVVILYSALRPALVKSGLFNRLR